MASIYERVYKNGRKNYWLNEWVNGKPKLTYLGTKYPLSKNMPRTGLPDHWVERLKRKASKRNIKSIPNPTLPDGKFSVIYADPPYNIRVD